MMQAARIPRRVTPFDNPVTRFMAGRFGVWLFLVSLGTLFAATLIVFVVIRLQIADVWPRDLPPLPRLLWASTAVLMVSSASMQAAVEGARRDRAGTVTVAMWITLALGLAFLVLQATCWASWLGVVSERWADSAEYRFALANFYVLTGLHALHVIGGLVPLAVVARRALDRAYTGTSHAGIVYAAMYWHFLGAVWIVLFATLLIGT